MFDVPETMIVRLNLDTSGFEQNLKRAESLSISFGDRFSRALENVIFKGKDLEDQLKKMALSLSSQTFNQAIAPFQKSFASLADNLVSAVLPFAKGGVVGLGGGSNYGSGPALFSLGGGRAGLAGEAGPEAILPLSRGADGRLGVHLQDERSAPNVIINIQTPDVEGFRRSEGQIAAQVSRLVARGNRNF